MGKFIAVIMLLAILIFSIGCAAYGGDRREADKIESVEKTTDIDSAAKPAITVGSREWKELSIMEKLEILPVGSDEWNQMSVMERMEAFADDEETAVNMTTPELLQTVLNYPYIINIAEGLSSDTRTPPWTGVNTVRGYYHPLNVFLDREDAVQLLREYMDRCEANGDVNDVEYSIETHYHICKTLMGYLESQT